MNPKDDKTSTPIKRHETIVQFSREHHYGLLLVWKIKQGIQKNIDPERISSYVLYFFENDILFSHIQEVVPENDLLNISAHHHTDSNRVDDLWTDHFWEKDN